MSHRSSAATLARRLCLVAAFSLLVARPAFADNYLRVCFAEANSSNSNDFLMLTITAWVPWGPWSQNTHQDYQHVEVSIGLAIPEQPYDQQFNCTADLWIHDGSEWNYLGSQTWSETLPGVPQLAATRTTPGLTLASVADVSLPRSAGSGRVGQPSAVPPLRRT
jgi:hypothetical protein